ncbi:MAG: LptE family protein [Deltaproteobacteria bacterium]
MGRIVILAFVAAALAAGCGYHVVGKGGGKQFIEGVGTVSIPMFENITGNADVESVVTSAIVDELMNAVKVEGDADAVLKGVIKSYELKPVSFSKSDVVSEYRLSVVMSVKFVKTSDDTIIWHDENISDYEDFTVNTSDISATKDAELAALRKIAKDTARLLRERVSAGF